MSYPLQRSLWESLESVFLANARNLLRDIAHDRGRPEKEILKAFSKDIVSVHLVEEDAPEQECCAIVVDSQIATRCRKAVYRNTCYCPLHHRISPNGKFAHGLPSFRRVKTESGDCYFIDPVTHILYDKDMKRIGHRTEKGIKVFKIEETTEDREDSSEEDV
jgi:hypothetical protein